MMLLQDVARATAINPMHLQIGLLAVISTLVAALVFVVKAQSKRADLRDDQVTRALIALELAVDTFRKFEKDEDRIHERILSRLDEHQKTQLAILEAIERLSERVMGRSTGGKS